MYICSYQLSVTVLLFPYCTENVVQSRGVSGMKNTELVVISLIEATSTYSYVCTRTLELDVNMDQRKDW